MSAAKRRGRESGSGRSTNAGAFPCATAWAGASDGWSARTRVSSAREPGGQQAFAQGGAIAGVLPALDGGPGRDEQRLALGQLADDRGDVGLTQVSRGAKAARSADHLESVGSAAAEEQGLDDSA